MPVLEQKTLVKFETVLHKEELSGVPSNIQSDSNVSEKNAKSQITLTCKLVVCKHKCTNVGAVFVLQFKMHYLQGAWMA